ncbi:hypothetical protein JRO89_XS01G0146700 [Xanthoceras sorbifolium]|uniref:Uncharacterized protein n=1 Tax=Xanthoceras sorbifolium TaxID=99658 RepID=A0ABQ8IKT3_9ROSI|nr:hypothetical protein JRO89_XS01G0146700 [Xanthoceras sorbifolium]
MVPISPSPLFVSPAAGSSPPPLIGPATKIELLNLKKNLKWFYNNLKLHIAELDITTTHSMLGLGSKQCRIEQARIRSVFPIEFWCYGQLSSLRKLLLAPGKGDAGEWHRPEISVENIELLSMSSKYWTDLNFFFEILFDWLSGDTCIGHEIMDSIS